MKHTITIHLTEGEVQDVVRFAIRLLQIAHPGGGLSTLRSAHSDALGKLEIDFSNAINELEYLGQIFPDAFDVKVTK